jgi:CheY-like chemotaxis protein
MNSHIRGRSGNVSPAVTKNKKTALLVDDVKVTQKVTSVALHQSGFVCDVADDGEVAIQMAKKQHYNVILMDVQLPKIDGVEATKIIREAEREDSSRTGTIIFGLTGNCKEDDLDRYNLAGMDGCIEKGCVVSRAMHEALAMKKENPADFIFINSRNVQSIRSKNIKDPLSVETKEEEPKSATSAETPVLPSPASSQDETSFTRAPPPITMIPSYSESGVSVSETDSPSHHLAKVKTALSVNPVSTPSPILAAKRHALLVDDVKVTQRITSAALQKTGYVCELASDGEMAVEMAKKSNYYVILMDVQLPIIDGVEATRLIRQYEKENEISPCIIFGLTGNCSDEALNLYAEAGMDGCIEKGCVVSRAMHEALAMKEENSDVFLFIDSRNVHFRLLDKHRTPNDQPMEQ